MLITLILFILVLTIVSIVVYYTGKEPKKSAANIIDILNSTDLGALKLKNARKQAEKNGVGVLLYEGNIYSIIKKDGPLRGSKEYNLALEKSMKEKFLKK